ncbi:MAG: hypothetical protein AUK37_04735 [Rhodobacterales bacterium CG2_30_65_12]|nr:MAG: hypothetical protein AUK37_04735 [Rhodobacterales bacterium CG2_30_65_12]
MIANLKAKAEGFDKKRIITAVAVLVIAGAAGHVMQRNANASEGTRVLAGSVPNTPTVAASPAAPVVAAARVPTATQEPELVVAETLLGTVTTPDIKPAIAGIAPAETAAPQTYIEPTPIAGMAEAPASVLEGVEPATASPEEVTRSASEPILARPEPPEPIGENTAANETFALAKADEAIDLVAEPDLAIAGCDLTLDAVPQPGAFVALTLSDPCNAGAKVEFDHAGLKFSDQLGPEGDLFLLVPAMAEKAIIVATLEGGQGQSVEVMLTDFAKFERVALIWKGATGLQLHALENGAGYGDPGHVWAEAPATPEAATAGRGGFLSVLGNTAEGYAADVYTYPASLMADGAQTQVSIEAQVTENTCGERIEGSILRTNAGRAPTAAPLAMTVPGCDAVGEYLVLNNLPQDLKLARN